MSVVDVKTQDGYRQNSPSAHSQLWRDSTRKIHNEKVWYPKPDRGTLQRMESMVSGVYTDKDGFASSVSGFGGAKWPDTHLEGLDLKKHFTIESYNHYHDSTKAREYPQNSRYWVGIGLGGDWKEVGDYNALHNGRWPKQPHLLFRVDNPSHSAKHAISSHISAPKWWQLHSVRVLDGAFDMRYSVHKSSLDNKCYLTAYDDTGDEVEFEIPNSLDFDLSAPIYPYATYGYSDGIRLFYD